MNRYKMIALLRDEETDQGGGRSGAEYPLKINVTADTEEEARRISIAQAQAVGLLVSRFLAVKEHRIDA